MKTQAAVSYPPSDISAALIQVSAALTVVILVILFVAWLAKRYGLITRHSAASGLKITGSLSMGAKERLVIVEVENTRLLLGVTSQQITCLYQLPAANISKENDNPPAKLTSDFASLLKPLCKRNRSQ